MDVAECCRLKIGLCSEKSRGSMSPQAKMWHLKVGPFTDV